MSDQRPTADGQASNLTDAPSPYWAARDAQRLRYEAELARKGAEEHGRLCAVVASAMKQWLGPAPWVRADNDEPLPVLRLAGVAIDALEAHGVVFAYKGNPDAFD